MTKYNLDKALDVLDEQSQVHATETKISEKTRGENLEKLVKFYFENEPVYKGKFNHVYDKDNIPSSIKAKMNQTHDNDLGIDLIAIDVFDKIYAIQVKRYKKAVSYDDVVTFLDQYHKNPNISYGIIVSNSPKNPSNNLLTQINEDENLTYVGIDDLESFNFAGYFKNAKNEYDKKKLRGYQEEAVKAVVNGFKTARRGQLIMATGTGKTYTSIKIVEQLAKQHDGEFRVLYVMPTLQLLKQTLENYWQDAPIDQDSFYSLAINSDSKTARNKKDQLLGFPATTSAQNLLKQYQDIAGRKKVLVFFSTYQSIQTVHDAQIEGLPAFDLIIADEAHKTVGASEKSDLQIFQQILPEDFVKADKRLFQTATPKVFKASVERKAESRNMDVFVMSNEEVYGKEFYKYSLGQAIKDEYLTDYQIIVSAIWDDDQRVINLLHQISDPKNETRIAELNESLDKLNKERDSAGTEKDVADLDQAIKETEKERKSLETKISTLEADIGKFINLSKSVDSKGQRIISNLHGELNDSNLQVKRLLGFSDNNKHSKQQVKLFKKIQQDYTKQVHADGTTPMTLNAEAATGSMNIREKSQKLADFAKDYGSDHVNFLNNVRFLTEGIDVPNLDAVVFLQPKKSETDIVQAVGRALRLDKNNKKKIAKIIIPALLRRNAQKELNLENNETNALDAAGFKTLREVIYNLRANDSRLEDEVNLAISFPIEQRPADENAPIDVSLDIDNKLLQNVANSLQTTIVEEAQLADIYQFRHDIANYAKNTRMQLAKYLKNLNSRQQKTYNDFYNEMNQIIDISDTKIDFIDTINQHIVLDPLLMAYFAPGATNEYESNSVRLAFEKFLNNIGFKRPKSYQMTQLVQFITRMVDGVKNPRKLQDILNSIYEVYFNADKDNNVDSSLKATVKPTPSPIVDYMVNSVDELLQSEFNTNLKSNDVGILEPFVGTGTFLVHIMIYLREKLHVTNDEILYKFKNQLFGQELLLIAYYIAASNLQVELKALTNQEASFDNLVMGNTFMSLDKEKFTTMNFGYLDTNVKKLAKQREAPIKIIMGNPPYLSQKMGPYKDIQESSLQFYKDNEVSKMVNLRNAPSLSNTYVGALTYAIKRLELTNRNIISYIFPNDWITAPTTIGIRKYIQNHFKDVYIVDLKGSFYKKDSLQGESVFGIQQGVAIVILVTDKSYHGKAKIHYCSLNSMTKNDKFNWLRNHTIKNTEFKLITPDEKYNYFPSNDQFKNLYDDSYQKLLGLDFEKGLGLKSNRDSWVINSNNDTLTQSVQRQINYYNSNVFDETFINKKKQTKFFKYNSQNKPVEIHDNNIKQNIKLFSYRPFVKKWLYAPDPTQKISNQIIDRYRDFFKNWKLGEITISNSGKQVDLLAVDTISECQFLKNSKVINVSKEIDNKKSLSMDLFNDDSKDCYDEMKNAAMLMYAIGHTPQYRNNFSNLVQDYYKYPVIKDSEIRNKLVKIGKKLMRLHLNYDKPSSPRFSDDHVSFYNVDPKQNKDYFHIDKIKLDKKDKHKIIFNDKIIINDLPDEVFAYQLNNRPAINYIMDYYRYNDNSGTSKTISSEVPDDPNLLDISEYWHGGEYVFEILMRVIQLSLETVNIMEELRQLQDKTDFLMLKNK